ncbi:DUF4956 domain-containing protein [Candidatus Latescibacterota bacterium]
MGSLTVALLCGLWIAILYRLTYKGTSYSRSYPQSLVVFAMITTIVIMVIGNNLARAFGLVGSMAIIRFRMAIKDTRDIVFIFFSLAIGMAAGVGLYIVAFGSTIFISIVMLFMSLSDFGAPQKREFLLQFHYVSDDDDTPPYVPVLEKYCRKFKLINIKSIGETGIIELSYYVILKKRETAKEFIHQIGLIEGASNVNFFFDEE